MQNMSKKFEIKVIPTTPDHNKEFTPYNHLPPEIQIEPKLLSRILEAAQKQLEVIKSREERAKVWDAARELAQTAIKKGQTAEEVIAESDSNPHSAKLIEKIYSALTNTKEKTTRLKRLTLQKIMLTLISLSMILAACVPQSEEKPPTETEPIVTLPADLPETDEPVTQEPPTKEAPATATSIPIGDVNLTYSSQYIGYELEANVFVANNWPASLSGEALSKFGNIALISNYEVSDISNNPRGLILKIVGDGWEEGTHVMESPFVSGELLFMTTSYASEQLGVEVASFEIGADGVPIAVDANGNVVGYVEYDSATGTTTYIKGNKDKAPNAVKIEKDYFAMSVEERWEHSAKFTNEINNGYDGLLEIIPNPDVVPNVEPGSNHSIYWNPTTNKWEYENDNNTHELDKTGESFGAMTAETIETDDGNFIIKDPETGIEMTFPGTVFLPGLGEISLKEIAAMNNEEFGTKLVDALIAGAPADENPILLSRTDSVKDDSNFLPGFVVGSPKEIYPSARAIKEGNFSHEHGDLTIRHNGANNFYIPIFNPKTGEVMWSIKTQQVNPVSTLSLIYSPDGSTSFDLNTSQATVNFGNNGQDEFAILIEHESYLVSHNEGGGIPLLQGNPGIFGPQAFKSLLGASSEEEMISLAKNYKLAVSYAFRIAYPKR